MNRLVFHSGALRAKLNDVLALKEESAFVVLASPCKGQDGALRLVVSEILTPGPDEYRRRTPTRVELEPVFVARALKRARSRHSSIVVAHTHPFGGPVSPSAIDVATTDALLPVFFVHVPDGPHGSAIFGRADAHVQLWRAPDQQAEMATVMDAGSDLFSPSNSHELLLDERQNRQVLALGTGSTGVLANLTIGIVGLGGTGSLVAQSLAHLGVRHFILQDPDTVELSNLSRVVGAGGNDVGAAKVEVAKRTIQAIEPGAEVSALRVDVTQQESARRLLDADFVFGCTDSQGSRAILAQCAYQYAIPVIDMGVRIEVQGGNVTHAVGRVQMLAPGLACLACTEALDPEAVRRDLMSPAERAADPYIVGAHIAQPAVIALNSVVSGLAVNMFLSATLGFPSPARYLNCRFDQGSVRSVSADARPGCNICSTSGFLARGDKWPAPGRAN